MRRTPLSNTLVYIGLGFTMAGLPVKLVGGNAWQWPFLAVSGVLYVAAAVVMLRSRRPESAEVAA